MSRLHTDTFEEATGKAAELFKGIKQALGKVPNAYLTIGSNAPDILAQTLQLNATPVLVTSKWLKPSVW